MYNNAGTRIKGLAMVFCVLGVIASVLLAVAGYQLTMSLTSSVFHEGNAGVAIIVALVVFAVFAVISWLGYLLLYGFGELIDETCQIRAMLQNPQDSNSDGVRGTEERKCPVCGNTENNGKYCGQCGSPL